MRHHITIVVVALMTLGACSSTVESQADKPLGPEYRHFETYAWVRGGSDAPLGESLVMREDLLRRVQLELDDRFERAGLHRVTPKDAQFYVSTTLSMRTETRKADPYFSFYVAERYEHGTLTLDFLHSETRERLWRGTSHVQLRHAARGNGVNGVKFQDTGEERNWRIEELVRAVLAEAGMLEPGEPGEVEPRDPNRKIGEDSKRALYRHLYEAFPDADVEISVEPPTID